MPVTALARKLLQGRLVPDEPQVAERVDTPECAAAVQAVVEALAPCLSLGEAGLG